MSNSLVALELRTIPVANKNGVKKEAPAVHAMWAETRVWTPYWPPGSPEQLTLPGAVDSWLNMAASVDADLGWLLRRKAHRFWSQICHDDGLHQWLETLLETFPRAHEIEIDHAVVQTRQQQLLHRLFLVFVRICTYKESSTDFFSPEYYGNMIYDKFLIEVPKILDICVLFGPCNQMITSRMVGNIFRCQPQYLEDLVTAGETMAAAMDSVGEQFQALHHPSNSNSSPNLDPVSDLVSYTGDIASTLAALMEAHQPAGLALHQAGLLVKIPSFYHNLVVPLQTHATSLNEGGEILVRRLELARHQLVTVFRASLDVVSLSPLLGGGEAHGEPLEELLTILTSVLSERSFILDYNAKFPIRVDFDLIDGLGRDIDPTRKHYILDAFTGTVTHSFTDAKMKKNPVRGEAEKTIEASQPPSDGAACSRPKEVEVESLISSVRDMLPHLGEGFVERCLESYDFQPAEVINAVLEGNLAPHLADLDQAMGREKKKVAPEPIVPRSVFEEDEFDVNTQDHIDMSRVHKGKKNKLKDAKKVLDDKSDLTWDLRDKFSKLGIVMDEVYVARGDAMDNAYDDEYDDTYDDVPVGQQEPDAADEGRAFVLPVALGGGKMRPERMEQDDQEEEEEEEGNPNRKPDFVRNPEEIRAEKERKWQERAAHQAKKRGGRGGGGAGPDVVGRARGQGQDKSVLIARRRKNDNKGRGQRVGAERKAARGMF